jgi:hypothetical protein
MALKNLKLTGVTEKLQNLPDGLFQGPLLKYKRDYKAMAKRVRRGESNVVAQEAEGYATLGAETAMQKKVTKEDMVKIKDTMAKITKIIIDAGKIIGAAVTAVKAFKAVKDGLQFLAELSEKTNLIAAAAAPVGTGGPIALIAWLKRGAAKTAMGISYAASNVLYYTTKWTGRYISIAGSIVEDFSAVYKAWFVGIALRTARAEKWGTASHDDVVKANQEAVNAAVDADDQKSKFIKDVRASGEFDDSIFQEDEELNAEYEDALIHDITYGE